MVADEPDGCGATARFSREPKQGHQYQRPLVDPKAMAVFQGPRGRDRAEAPSELQRTWPQFPLVLVLDQQLDFSK
jgi:hypothetical protein